VPSFAIGHFPYDKHETIKDCYIVYQLPHFIDSASCLSLLRYVIHVLYNLGGADARSSRAYCDYTQMLKYIKELVTSSLPNSMHYDKIKA